MSGHNRKFITGLFLSSWVLTLVAACVPSPAQNSENIAYPTPTSGVYMDSDQNQIFLQLNPESETSATPTVSSLFNRAQGQIEAAIPIKPQKTPNTAPSSSSRSTIEENIILYDDALNPNWSVVGEPGMEVDLQSTDVVQSGDVSLRFAPQQYEDTLLFAVNESSTDVYERGEVLGISFWLNSGGFILGNDALTVAVVGSNEYPYWVENDRSVQSTNDPVFSETRLYFLGVSRDIPPNTWVLVELWLDERIYDPDYLYVTGFYIKNDESAMRNLYLDDVRLITLKTTEDSEASSSLETTPSQESNAGVSEASSGTSLEVYITVDADKNVHEISPMIYGVSAASGEYLQNLGLKMNSWGGNPSTRYNWRIGNAWNAGRDYFYRNGNYGSPPGRVADGFIMGTLDAGAEVRLAVPTLGWVAKNDDINTCSFPLPDGTCWDADGASCSNPGEIADPTRANVKSDSASIVSWMQHIYNYKGFDVRIIAMDNEPELWGSTHYDVHPECTTYQEILAKYLEYATAIRKIVPDVELAGPVTSGWYHYWNSAAGNMDKLLNGNQPFLPWFLSQVHQHDEETGVKSIDVLDIHYYPDGLFNQESDRQTAAHRLRSTRSLWDPGYVDESWIDEPIYLIPRMKALIEENYPGLKLGISEWNFGGDSHISGALAIADVLGVFGKEDLYYASYWTFPGEGSPGYFGFKIFTNYDNEGGSFGDLSVHSESNAVDVVSSYASVDSETGNLHIILINKDITLDAAVQVEIENFTPGGTAVYYRYSEANLTQIKQGDLKLPGSTFEMTLPPYSITHLVIEAGNP
jgi:hypothetical protein